MSPKYPRNEGSHRHQKETSQVDLEVCKKIMHDHEERAKEAEQQMDERHKQELLPRRL
jgi:hypothetical protein